MYTECLSPEPGVDSAQALSQSVTKFHSAQVWQLSLMSLHKSHPSFEKWSADVSSKYSYSSAVFFIEF